jgi:hypothetical protein
VPEAKHDGNVHLRPPSRRSRAPLLSRTLLDLDPNDVRIFLHLRERP